LIKVYPPSFWRGVLGKKIHLFNPRLLGEEFTPLIIRDADGAHGQAHGTT